MDSVLDLFIFPREVTILRRRAAERKTPLFLVGGAVRDRLAGRPAMDYDFAVATGGQDLPWSVAREIGGKCFWLDRARGQCRIVLKKHTGILTLDFSPLQEGGIDTDLAGRDFTINACALDLSPDPPVFIDPLSGVKDLRDGVLRSCSATSFFADPLRLLRAFRLAAAFDLHMEPATRIAIADHARLISTVAPERIRDELFKILAGPNGAATLKDMQSLGLLPCLFPRLAHPEQGFQSVDTMEHACVSPGRWLPEHDIRLAEYLAQEIEGGITLHSLLKFASLVASSGESAGEIGGRFRLGRKAVRCLRRLIEGVNEQVFSLGSTPGSRSMYRLFKDLDAGPEIVVFSLVHHGLPGDLARRLLSFYFVVFHELEELITGRDIQEEFGIEEGEKVGKSLHAVQAAERAGSVATRGEAVDFLRRKLLTKDHS